MFSLPRLTDDGFLDEFSSFRTALARDEVKFSEQNFKVRYAESLANFPNSFRSIGEDRLLHLRHTLEPLLADDISTRTFDLTFMETIWNFGSNMRSELGDPQVWNFLTLVLLPDIACHRFSGDKHPNDRFTGGNRRHVFQRLWLRRLVLGDEYASHPRLDNDNYGQIMERRFISERPLLAQRLARSVIENDCTGSQRRSYARALMANVMQLASVIAVIPDDANQIDAIVTHLEKTISY